MPNFPGWAFDNIAQAIKEHGMYDYDIKYEQDYRQFRGKELPRELLDFSIYSRIILFAPWMDWANLPLERTVCLFHERFEMDGYRHDKYLKTYVTSDISYNYMQDKANVVKVQAGVDTVFTRSEFHHQLDGKIRVGWVGAKSGHVEKKGYDQFYLPLACDEIELWPHLKEEHYTSDIQDMVDYYNHLDVLVCTSSWEGYPLPILEATSCGTPVISTRVGVAPEILPPDQIVERDVEIMRKRILKKDWKVGNINGWSWRDKIMSWEINL